MGISVSDPLRIPKLILIYIVNAFTRAVEGHFKHPYSREWMDIADTVTPLLAELVGERTYQKCMSR
jgi:kynureninase